MKFGEEGNGGLADGASTTCRCIIPVVGACFACMWGGPGDRVDEVLSDGLVELKKQKVSGSAALNDKFQGSGKFQLS